ncbi:MAG: thioredoxin-dependent thiol peroxidase [Candidatus Magasanikbacteria bacterium]|nr:thioredoxin-dependent thiol peroxidase [Candidatus Magasanikbacteria bacterium]
MPNLTNKKAPNFSLKDQDGKTHKLSDYTGQIVLLYFYPKDMTPGCTVEAQCFRDRNNEFKKYNVQVLGVSADSVEKHKKFETKQELNFPLLSDEKKEVIEKYGVWVEKSLYGKKYMGIQRDSFLIGRNGKIIKHYEKVNPAKHVDEVLADIAQLSH